MAKIVIKIGGIASQHLDAEILKTLLAWKKQGDELVIVHGGGFAINSLMEEAGVAIQKVNGLRVTSQQEMELVEHALLDIVGKDLVSKLETAGLSPYQLIEELAVTVKADYIDKTVYGEVGQVYKVETGLLNDLLEEGKVPLLASLGCGPDGQFLNINADYLATAVAQALAAEQLILMTDVKGVLEEGQVLAKLTISDALTKIDSGVISGGMVPKMKSAIETIQAGVGKVLIGDNLTTGTLIERG